MFLPDCSDVLPAKFRISKSRLQRPRTMGRGQRQSTNGEKEGCDGNVGNPPYLHQGALRKKRKSCASTALDSIWRHISPLGNVSDFILSFSRHGMSQVRCTCFHPASFGLTKNVGISSHNLNRGVCVAVVPTGRYGNRLV